MSFFVDIHALQTLPPSNINRDDTGSPKSAIFGGVSRQRVSSQAWKSVIRRNFEEHLDRSEIGVRTRQVADMIVDLILTQIKPNQLLWMLSKRPKSNLRSLRPRREKKILAALYRVTFFS